MEIYILEISKKLRKMEKSVTWSRRYVSSSESDLIVILSPSSSTYWIWKLSVFSSKLFVDNDVRRSWTTLCKRRKLRTDDSKSSELISKFNFLTSIAQSRPFWTKNLNGASRMSSGNLLAILCLFTSATKTFKKQFPVSLTIHFLCLYSRKRLSLG